MKKIQLLALSITILFTFSAYCINPSALEPGPVYNIGDYAQGGVIFWLTPDKRHGIVADIIDLNNGSPIRWDTAALPSTLVGAKATGLARGNDSQSAGLMNTPLIVALYGTSSSYAALLCAQRSVRMEGVTYDDWYLPSIQELQMMMTRRTVINGVAVAKGGSAFASATYWSSYEANNTMAQTLNFSNSGTSNASKTATHRVRAARIF
jgi:hypothetical protein